jgi:hypothetical protein
MSQKLYKYKKQFADPDSGSGASDPGWGKIRIRNIQDHFSESYT